jgi:hypothetical protein
LALHGAPLDDDQRGIKVDAVHRIGKRAGVCLDLVAPEPCIHFVDEFLEEFDERAGCAHAPAIFRFPVGAAQILAGVNSVLLDVTEQRPECRDLVVIGVAAVIDDDIERSEFVRQPLKKFRVALIADRDMGTRTGLGAGRLERLAVGVDVEPHDPRLRAEVAPPDLQGSAVGDADLQNRYFASAKPGKVPVINFEIVLPLVQAAAGVNGDHPVKLGRRAPKRRNATQALQSSGGNPKVHRTVAQ